MSCWTDCFIWPAAGLYNDYDYWCCVSHCVCLCVFVFVTEIWSCLMAEIVIITSASVIWWGRGQYHRNGVGLGQKLSPCSSLLYSTVCYVPYALCRLAIVCNFAAYIDSMVKLLSSYQNDVKALAKQGNKDKLQTLLSKKKLVEKEVNKLFKQREFYHFWM